MHVLSSVLTARVCDGWATLQDVNDASAVRQHLKMTLDLFPSITRLYLTKPDGSLYGAHAVMNDSLLVAVQ